MATKQDVNCIYQNMPVAIKGFTVQNSDSTFTVILNARHTREQNLLSYAHELSHINNGDFDQEYNIGKLEYLAHTRIDF